jgi:hypothetical protein
MGRLSSSSVHIAESGGTGCLGSSVRKAGSFVRSAAAIGSFVPASSAGSSAIADGSGSFVPSVPGRFSFVQFRGIMEQMHLAAASG